MTKVLPRPSLPCMRLFGPRTLVYLIDIMRVTFAQAAAYGVTGEVTGLAADVPVFALFNSSKNVRLPDKIDAAMV